MKIGAVTVTWNRPELLGRMIECFNRQDYDDRELLILDDAGQYPDGLSGDRWKIVSIGSARFATLGQKRNAAAALLHGDIEALAVWDDDDIYLPHALSSCVNALKRRPWCQPRYVFEQRPGGALHVFETFGRYDLGAFGYAGGWAYLRSVFEELGGYPAQSNGEDFVFAERMRERYGVSTDPLGDPPDPYYIYSRIGSPATHLSHWGGPEFGYQLYGRQKIRPLDRLDIGWQVDYSKMPIAEGINPRPW